MLRAALFLVCTFAVGACASKQEDITPTIAISPGAKERILVMDRLRHYGSPRRLLPRVTVEEIDDVELHVEEAHAPELPAKPVTADPESTTMDAGEE